VNRKASAAFAIPLVLSLIYLADGSPAAERDTGASADELAATFLAPPPESRPWVFWRWLNGAASKEGITRDFEEMEKQGIGGALLFDAGEVDPKLQQGPPFMSDEWRELFRHSVKEAHRCGITLSVNLCSGWNAGGPWITPEHAAKTLVSSQTIVTGSDTTVAVGLAQPPAIQNFYRDLVALAMPVEDGVLAGGLLTASSQTSDGGVALVEDGNDQTFWISKGWKVGMGPTLEKPAFLQFDFAEPWAAAGCYLKPHVQSGPKDVDELRTPQPDRQTGRQCCAYLWQARLSGGGLYLGGL